jgi:hypothetical protein
MFEFQDSGRSPLWFSKICCYPGTDWAILTKFNTQAENYFCSGVTSTFELLKIVDSGRLPRWISIKGDNLGTA